MEEDNIVKEIEDSKKDFGITCRKLSGALTIEILKEHLEEKRVKVSNRDVFIKGIKSEIDLLMVKKSAIAEHNLIYNPSDVIVALEIKSYGSFGEKTSSTIKDIFNEIKLKNNKVYCAYITLLERETYKHKVTCVKLGYPAYTIFFHKSSGKKFQLINTNEWNKFLDEVRRL